LSEVIMTKSMIDQIEQQELIQKLINSGHGKLVEVLLEGNTECWTKKGRLNKSGACRVLGWKPKELEQALEECRDLLGDVF
jgi:hypothetical protein